MARLTKKRKAVLDKVDADKLYPLADASALIKEISTSKFDASIDLAIRLGVDPRKSNQMVRGVVSLTAWYWKECESSSIVYTRQRTRSKRCRC